MCVAVKEVRVVVKEEVVYPDDRGPSYMAVVTSVTYLTELSREDAYPEEDLMGSKEELVEWFADAAGAAAEDGEEDEDEDRDAVEDEE